MNRYDRMTKELREQGTDPQYHPLIRDLFKAAAGMIDELRADLKALQQQGTDHD